MTHIKPHPLKTIMSRASILVKNQRDQQTLLFDIMNSGVNQPALADLPDADFLHDVNGIMQHMNRKTETLDACFIPRAGILETAYKDFIPHKKITTHTS